MDVLSDVLGSLRLNASIYCALDLSAPWGISFLESPTAPFHLVESGSCWLLVGGSRRVRLSAGDLVVLFSCRGHTLCDVPSTRPDPLRQVLQHQGQGGVVRFGGKGSVTRIICGKFALDEKEGAPGSLRHLPRFVHIRRKDWPQFASFSATLRLLASEVRSAQPGSKLAARFLTEVLLIQVLRVLLNGQRARVTGWLQVLRDPPIATALAAIHEKPEHPWSVDSLAAKVGLSRSVFAARFHRRMGETPMAYVGDYRLRLAARWLQETDLSVSEILHRLGYSSAAAFTRAFKRKYGLPPLAYKRDFVAGWTNRE